MSSLLNKTLASSLLILSVSGMSACSTVNPYTSESQTSKAATGAAIGAIAGAVIGAATGDDAKERRERALKGAGIGAISGGGVGYYMDVQEAKLRERLEGTGVSVTRDGDNIILNMPGNVTFDTGSSALKSGFFTTLDSVVIVLNEYESTLVTVAGHTDSVGSDESNNTLSVNRASAVATYLQNQQVVPDRLIVVGYGETMPIATNDTDAGRAQNRRVEITLDPITE